jgi:hypothetical protein
MNDELNKRLWKEVTVGLFRVILPVFAQRNKGKPQKVSSQCNQSLGKDLYLEPPQSEEGV